MISGADPGFKVRAGGALKKIAPRGGRHEHFWGILCEKSRFYAKKSYFFPILGGGAPGAPPPWAAPGYSCVGVKQQSLTQQVQWTISDTIDFSNIILKGAPA